MDIMLIFKGGFRIDKYLDNWEINMHVFSLYYKGIKRVEYIRYKLNKLCIENKLKV